MWLCQSCATAAGFGWGHYERGAERWHSGASTELAGACGDCGTRISAGTRRQYHHGFVPMPRPTIEVKTEPAAPTSKSGQLEMF